jgi:ribosome-associated protein YbcJ (S4-like RNA binding protein)
MKSKLTKQDVLAELAKYGLQPIQENDITLKDVLKAFGWEQSAARRMLKLMVADGKLVTLLVRDKSGSKVRAWRQKL